ncbi:ESX secretion-associated protein EspG [Kibdelosporangium persicum]|uniref:ESAT-6 protein secretion system EspG family protein n=1 Tax=Kibdelosporangium persicum TaxID=2698649 RepID=A0ABX2FCN8_9PSEU|nr:ESX secretion-associated protein EspG [Kibdelosporangium persicum]NRN69128.1 ESAT-6 protein secretion system EspG family protein [Kibdelosporangium persicum]
MSEDVALHPIEVELLCAFAEVEPPFPLEIPDTGLTEAERSAVFHAAGEQLAERGLADDEGPLGLADEFVHLLRYGGGVLDLVVAEEKTTVGAVVLVHRGDALVVVQRAADPFGTVVLRQATLDRAVDELYQIIPRLDAAPTTPFTLPRKPLQAAFEALIADLPTEDGVRPRRLPPRVVEEILAQHGVDDRVSRRMVQYLQPVLGNGQAGVARRAGPDGDWHRAGDEIRWLDTENGRYQLDGDGDWMSVNPFAPEEIRSALRKLAATLR